MAVKSATLGRHTSPRRRRVSPGEGATLVPGPEGGPAPVRGLLERWLAAWDADSTGNVSHDPWIQGTVSMRQGRQDNHNREQLVVAGDVAPV